MLRYASSKSPWCLVAVIVAVFVNLGLAAGCEPEKPPAPAQTPPGAEAAPETSEVYLELGTTQAVFTFAGDKGSFQDGSKLDLVPEASRGMVLVNLVGGEKPPMGMVWVANLKSPPEDGRVKLETVERGLFEELALGQGLSSHVSLPGDLEPPKEVVSVAGEIIVYKTSWCGVCKKVEAYLKRKGVKYVAKDVEKDRAAAAELQAKKQSKGITSSSVPVIDIGGELMVGFDRGRLEQLLAS